MLENIADAIAATMPALEADATQHPQFAELGARMQQQWELGVASSLRG